MRSRFALPSLLRGQDFLGLVLNPSNSLNFRVQAFDFARFFAFLNGVQNAFIVNA